MSPTNGPWSDGNKEFLGASPGTSPPDGNTFAGLNPARGVSLPMTDRVTSDSPRVETIDGTLARHGSTDRLKVALPAHDDLPADEVVRVVLDGSERRARFDAALSGDGVEVRGVYDTPRLARTPGEGDDRLAEWLADRDLDAGRTVHLDVVEPGFRYGLRAPGERATYDAGNPEDSLASIAERLDGA